MCFGVVSSSSGFVLSSTERDRKSAVFLTRSRAFALNSSVLASRSYNGGVKLRYHIQKHTRVHELTANFMRSSTSFASAAALASSLRTLAMLSLVRTCHL